MAFGKAFAAARKAGKKIFTYNGKKYTTKLAEDTPKNVPTPTERPRIHDRPKTTVGTKPKEKSLSRPRSTVTRPDAPVSSRTKRGDAQVQEHRASEIKRLNDELSGRQAKKAKPRKVK